MGNSIQHFSDGDVLLIGSNLPHYWRCDDEYFQGNSELIATATVVHFQDDFWGKTFLTLPENQVIAELPQRADQGIRFVGPQKENVKQLLRMLLN